MRFAYPWGTRYSKLKEAAPECILLMQVGAFMQVMNKDAETASEVTGLKLQMVGKVGAPMVVGGFPKSGLDKYPPRGGEAHCRKVCACRTFWGRFRKPGLGKYVAKRLTYQTEEKITDKLPKP